MQNKKILIPLYVADAVMFAAVIFMATPYIARGEAIDFGVALLLCALVFFAMLLMCVPILLQYLLEKNSAKKNGDEAQSKTDSQIKTIYTDLRTLRDSLISQIDSSDSTKNDLETVAGDLENLQTKLDALSDSFNELKETLNSDESEGLGILSRVQELEDSSARFAGDFDEFKQESENRLGTILTEFSALKTQFENFYEAINSIGSDEEIAQEKSQEISQETETQVEDSKAEDVADEVDDSSSESEIKVEPLAQNPEVESEIDSEIFEDDDVFSGDEVPEENTESEEGEVEELAEDSENDDVEESSENAEDESPKSLPNWSGMIEKALSNSQANVTKETVSRFIEKSKPAENTELFDESEIAKNPEVRKARSGDTAVVINSFIGLGNVPYIRGTGMGLSQEKGVALKMLEIGKWQWVCDGLPTSPIKFTIWLNDSIESELGEVELNPAEIITLDVKF